MRLLKGAGRDLDQLGDLIVGKSRQAAEVAGEMHRVLVALAPNAEGGHYFFYYGHYYAVQVFWQVGGTAWRDWYTSIRDDLLERQLDDGSWQDPYGREYATAMACLVLQMPRNHLPIFQR